MSHGAHLPAAHDDKLNMTIALTAALISVLMAGIKVETEKSMIKMHHEEAAAVDTWNQYQAKRLREYMAGIGLNNAQVIATMTGHAQLKEIKKVDHHADGRAIAHDIEQVKTHGDAAASPIEKLMLGYQKDIEKYKADEKHLSHAAKAHDAIYEQLDVVHERCDVGESTLVVSLAMLAVTALTNKRWLLYLSWGIAAIGAGFGAWAYIAAQAIHAVH